MSKYHKADQLGLDPVHIKKTDPTSAINTTTKLEKKSNVKSFMNSWNSSKFFQLPSNNLVLISSSNNNTHKLISHELVSSLQNTKSPLTIQSPTVDGSSIATPKCLPFLPNLQSHLDFPPNYALNHSNNDTLFINNNHIIIHTDNLPYYQSHKSHFFYGFSESVSKKSKNKPGSRSMKCELFTSNTAKHKSPPSTFSIQQYMNYNRPPNYKKKARFMSQSRSSLFNKGPLPDVILLMVFQYLDLKSLMVMQCVCKHWKKMLTTSQYLLNDLDLRPYNTTISDKSIVPITNFAGTRPTKVDISNCFHLTDKGFSYLINGIDLFKLKVFKMISVWEVSSLAIMDLTLPSISSELEEIDFSNCRNLDDSTLTQLIGWIIAPFGLGINPSIASNNVVGCPKLRRISLSHCKKITDKSMYHMAMFASDRIEFLDLTRCTTITDYGFSFWNFRSFYSLRHLCLADCTFLTNKTISSIASAAKNLQSLVLSFCCALTEISVEILAVKCTQLRNLDLSYCGSAVSDTSLSMAALYLLDLERLSVRGCVRVTNVGVNNILRLADHRNLRFLDITQCRNVINQIDRNDFDVTIKQS